MKRIIILCIIAAACVMPAMSQGIYGFSVKNDKGEDVSLSEYRGKVLLIVNTATRCGFTPQYTELENLYAKYREQGLEILDFPCNQFGEQAPGTIEEIHSFCTLSYGIQFPQFDKVDVNGSNESPLFAFLKSKQGFKGFNLDDQTGKFMDEMLRKQDPEYDKKPSIKWNFTKFLVSRDGRIVKRYEPTDNISDIEADVYLELNPVLSNIMARRSVRRYLDKPVEHDKLELVIRCGINAPSAVNSQPWIIRVVEDRKLIDDITEVYKKENHELVARDANFRNMFRNAPDIICVCTPENGKNDLDAGLLGENMMLAAQSMGLGTCCLGGPVRFLMGNANAKFFIDRLNIPENYKLTYILAIGYPDEQPDARPRDASKVEYIK